MGVTVGAQDELPPRGLPDERVNAEPDGEPRADAPTDNAHEKADTSGHVGPLARRFAIPAWLSDRVHDMTVLSVIMLIQLVWLSVLAYGLFSILK